MVALLLKYNCDLSLCDFSGATAKDLTLESSAQGALEIVDQLSMEDIMNKLRIRRMHEPPPLSKPVLQPDITPKEPLSRGASSHGSKSTLKSQVSATPPVMQEMSGVDLDEEIKQNCIPLIRGTELTFEEVINRGSSCEVFKGRWRGCEVAIKKFKDEYKQNPKELSKFVKEMQSLAHVRHPNLILLMGICTDLSNLCLVTEYVPNLSLFYALHSKIYAENKSRRLTLPERFQVAIQICKGLAYLHECDPPIVHRDLKPENCLLDFSLNLKIADFGLARPLTCFSNEEALTTTCIGTTRFMAPELFEKEKLTTIGVEVDIWALGCILIELFSNKRPWDYISSSNANCIYYEVNARQIFKKKPVPVPDSIPAEVRTLIQRCCQYQPKHRPAARKVLE
jgi:serine/threonine protein kinase